MQPSSSGVRPYYIFTAVVLGIGAILSVAVSSWSSLFVFSVLCGTAVWVATRVDRDRSAPAPGAESKQRMRPSERRRQRRQG